MSNDNLLICSPIEKGRRPPVLSVADDCQRCGRRVWRALSSPANLEPVCFVCAVKLMAESSELVLVQLPTEKQLKEILEQAALRHAGGSRN